MNTQNKLSRRDAIKAMGTLSASLLLSTSAQATTKLSQPASHKKVKIVIAGGGTAGMIAAARLGRSAPNAHITLIAPNKTHLYQSGQMFVAAGLYIQDDNERKTAELLEDKVEWLKEHIIAFHPKNNSLTTDKSGDISYDYLVVALGVEYNYEAIEGLNKDMIGKDCIASVYANDTLEGSATGGDITDQWFKEIRRHAQKKKTKIICTEPNTPIKGVGTSLDILFLGNDIFRGKGPFSKRNVVKNIEFSFAKPDNTLFPFTKFHTVIEKKIKQEKNITPLYEHQLKAVDAKNKIATFLSNNKKIDIAYDFLHVVPPMRAPKVFRDSPLAFKDGKYQGYMNVDAQTLCHKEYKNVFGLGDILGISLGKTGGSAQEQAIIIQDNLAAAIENKPLPMQYNGYTVSPVKIKFGEVLLAEFNEKKALPTFWIDPYKPRWIWWELNLHVMRKAYFSLMMRGMM
ncbi:NAD(P)/FAD-dependent oxidoreductase [Sulfurimonas autotrophica]|uniref:FAD-dependent pyridine nucleotide-disulfide oxidoreductase n=1 Tax=Sulfurimonas autotrophica (strain ATCC BAA-671 / DSM 16294 / JCM 11897 / OK10) TaxID=563040 RepID=E0UTV9_SULAO|nr:FAD-dependent oxidoreductase [Sulfurimonas autotrophica]ADN09403.1 FAD-dependent pyridine nucleotide-disulfide oxidoreductase [Sulfurimonas autotrophica DSM 16294]